MKISFAKYHGTGNDFIIIDNRQYHWAPSAQQAAAMCARNFGIGADGLMLLSERSGFDFAMTYFNADGKESTMCGNGGRCMTAFAVSLGLAGTVCSFWAADGMHTAEVLGTQPDFSYRLRMKDTRIGHIFNDGIYIDTGSPHFVQFVSEVSSVDVPAAGKILRHDPRFAPGGTNVDFVGIQKEGLFVRTFERGVENETLSCGTGVTASALAYASRNPGNHGLYQVSTMGGKLQVSFEQAGDIFKEIWLEGPATFVYKGEIEI